MIQWNSIANGYVSQWDLEELIRKSFYEDNEEKIDINDSIYAVDYEYVSYFIFTHPCTHVCSINSNYS